VTTFFAKVINKLWYVLATVIILAALLVSIARLLTPVMNEHRADFEKLASDLLEMPVIIGQVSVSWRGYSPEIFLEHVTVLDPETQKPKLVMQGFEIDFSIWRSLWARRVFVKNMTVSGVKLTINQQASGLIQIGDLTALNVHDASTGSSVKVDKIFAWIFSEPRLGLENIAIIYTAPKHAERSLTLQALSLRNTGKHHVLDGKGVLNQEMPTKVDIHLGWDGDVRKLAEAKGHTYLYLEGLSLPQWFSKLSWADFQVKQGVASVKIWARWDHNQFQKIQSIFQAYSIALYSVTQKTTEVIDRVSANVGWKRDGKNQIFSGEQIFIDFADHLWPALDYSVKVGTDANGNPLLNAIQLTYLNLSDASRLALESSLLPDNIRQALVALNLKGEMQELRATLPGVMTDFANLSLSTKFIGLTANAWQKFPGVVNLSGGIAWDGKKANLALDSNKTSIIASQLFPKTLYLEQLHGTIQLAKLLNNDWVLQTNNFHVANADLSADTTLAMTIPQNDSPLMDLSVDFAVANTAHLSSNLPLQVFEPGLQKWLREAFLTGRIESGKAILKGRLKNFPFDDNSGIFLVTSQIKDLDFNYAPGWPHILHTNAELTFSKNSMVADVHTGELLGVPLANVRGVIPTFVGSTPGRVDVQCTVQTDLAEGLRLIQESPLKNKIGKDLTGLKLSGPMQIKLGLSVPFRKPEETKVTGDVTASDATLDLPEWKLTLNKLNGAFLFTENSLEAKNLQGQFFGAPVTFRLTTLHDAAHSGQIRADLSSMITVPALQDWLAMPVTKVVMGSAAYQVQLYLSSHTQAKSDHVVIHSDLKGMSIALPHPYGKNIESTQDFQLDIDVNGNQLLKTKLRYGNLLNAALDFQKSKREFRLLGGELSLGGQDANWQTEPGILVTGKMPQIDWDTWQHYFASLQDANKTNAHTQFDMLRGIDLNTDVIDALGVQLHDAHIQASKTNDAWSIKLDSTEMAGQITLPFNLQQPVQGQFQHMYINATTTNAKHPLDPKTILPLSLDINDLRYGEIKIGRVVLNVEPNSAGLVIKQLHIDEPALKLDATGEWSSTQGKYNSHLQGEVKTPNISNVLNQWGFNSSNFVGNAANATFDLSWLDAPYHPAMASMSGRVSLNLEEGRIVEISESSSAKMGLGRLLNVFSLSTIPRRLSLDFSDLVEKGYSFDLMKGDFTLKTGSAFTENMHFDGPVARVGINGRIGLQAKDFDIKLEVTPHVTGSLPIVAAIAGGPVVGVATWVVDKVISHEVSRVSTYQYSVKGPWDNPVWTQLQAMPQKMSDMIFPLSFPFPSLSGGTDKPVSEPKKNQF